MEYVKMLCILRSSLIITHWIGDQVFCKRFVFSFVLFSLHVWSLKNIFLVLGKTHWPIWCWTNFCKLAIFLDTNTKWTACELQDSELMLAIFLPHWLTFSFIKCESKFMLQRTVVRNKWAICKSTSQIHSAEQLYHFTSCYYSPSKHPQV